MLKYQVSSIAFEYKLIKMMSRKACCVYRCLVRQEPAEFDATRGQVLSNIAELLVRQLERKWAESEARRGHVQLMRSLACYDEAFLFLDTSKKGDWRVLHMNQAASKLLGKSEVGEGTEGLGGEGGVWGVPARGVRSDRSPTLS